MKPGHLLILGSAIVGSAIAIGLHLATMGSRHSDRAPQAASPSLPSAPAKKRGLSISSNTDSRTARAARVSEKSRLDTQRDPAVPTPEFRIHGKPPAGRVANERDWFASAERIRQQANHDLGILRETLDLSPNQQQRIFDVFARNSPSWQPGMLTGGSYGVGLVSDGVRVNRPSAKTRPESNGDVPNNPEAASAHAVNEEVMAVLDPDQQQALLDEESDRRAWWEEILPQLLPPEFPAAADADDPAASLLGGGDTKAYEGPTGILEE
jgi:hypothetical protein